MRSLLSMITSSSLLVLTACGGGGGDAGSTPTNVSGSDSSRITASNYVTVGEQVLASSLSLSMSSSATNFVVGPTIQTAGLAQAPSGTAKPQLAKIIDQFSRAQQMKAAAAVQQTSGCSLGGSVTMSVSDRNNNGVEDAGDSITVQLSNCREDTETMNGSVTILINELSGDPATNVYSLGFGITFANLSISSGTGSSKLDGSYDLTSRSVGSNKQTIAISAPSLVIDGAVNGASYSARMSNFNFSENITPAGSGSRSSITFGGTLSSSAMAAQSTVSVETLSPFVQDSRAAFPSSGQVLITSAAGGRVRLTAQSSSNVLFEVDADSNGTYEAQQLRPWSQLI
jgi:hypothetical protein